MTGSGSLPLANPGPPRSARQSRATLALERSPASSGGPASVKKRGVAACSSTAAAAKAPTARAGVRTSTDVPWRSAPCLSRTQADVGAGTRGRSSPRSSATTAKPPALTTRSAALSASPGAQRIHSRRGRGTPAAAAARGSSAPPVSTSAAASPAPAARASAASITDVRPDDRRPAISLSAARGHPPPSSASSPGSPLPRCPRSSSSRWAVTM